MNTQKGFSTILLVIILLVIGGGLYLYENNKAESTPTNLANDINDVPSLNQGIVITSVKPNDLVKLPITIGGYLDGNGWTANEGEIGFVEVFDANGESISNQEFVKTTTDWMKFPTYFEAIVGDRQMMSSLQTDTGTVKITSIGVKDGEQIKSITIPVRFK